MPAANRAIQLGVALPSLRYEFSEKETDYFLDIDLVNHAI